MFKSKIFKTIITINILAFSLFFNLPSRSNVSAKQDDDEQLRIILRAVSQNLMTFERSLPDLVCQEEARKNWFRTLRRPPVRAKKRESLNRL
jgi:hypothetical protein